MPNPFKPDSHELAAYHRDVTRWFSLPTNVRNSGLPITIGRTPAVLRLLGVTDAQMQIDRGTLIKVSRPHGDDPKGHGITLNQMKRLPEQLADPIAIFQSKTAGGFVVLTDMDDANGEPIIAAVHIGKRVGKRSVNDIASVHGRSHAELARWVSGGMLLYLNEKKIPASPMGHSLQLLRSNPSGRGSSTIVGPDDVVKFHDLNKSLPAILVIFGVADKHALLKSHIAAYTDDDERGIANVNTPAPPGQSSLHIRRVHQAPHAHLDDDERDTRIVGTPMDGSDRF